MINITDLILSILYVITLFYTIFWLITLIEEKPDKKIKIKKHPLVSIAVPAYNEEKTILKTLNSIINLKYPRDKLRIVVVNDGSTDSTREKVCRFIKKNKKFDIKLINQENHGKWSALNKALKIAKGEFFACLDADSFVEKKALKKMIPYFSDKNIAAVVPLLKIKDPKNLLQKVQWYEYLVNMFYKRLLSFLNCIHVTPGPFSIYRKEVIDSLGSFKKGHCTEDLEMALRLQKHHYKIIQVMDVEVYTHTPENIKALYRQRNRWNKGSVLNVWDYKKMIFNKNYGDFGMFQMPIVLSAGFIALFLVLFILYQSLVKPLLTTLRNLNLVNFDIFTFIRNFKLNFMLLDLDYYKIVIMIMMCFISITVLIIAHRYTKEKITKQGIFSLLTFLFFYYVFLGVVWCGVVRDLILRKKARW